jgi:hypothetical protein
MTFRNVLLCATFLAGSVSIASASIIPVSLVELDGTGLGAVSTLLTIQSPGNSTIETGCTAWNGTAVTTTGCGFADSKVQAQFAAPTLASTGATSAADLRIVFNASEPGNASDIQLNQLVLTFYNQAGTLSNVHSLAAPIFFPSVQSGTGNSGFVFSLDTAEAAAAQTFINNNGGLGSVHIGLGASAGMADGGPGSATGGLETFFAGSSASIGPTVGSGDAPEPDSFLLIGAGLLTVAFAARRYRPI